MLKIFNLKNTVVGLFILLILSPVTGELWRLKAAGFEFLPSDLIIPALFVCWVIYKIKYDRKLHIGKIGKMIVVFLFIITITYLINLFRFDVKEMIIAFSYLGRFGMYLILPIMLFDILNCHTNNQIQNVKYKIESEIRNPKSEILIIGLMIGSMVLIAILGFLQLKYFPSFLDLGMYMQGWDPHIGRLLSTWFDPNFIGGYMAFMLGIIISLSLYFLRKSDFRTIRKIGWSPLQIRSSLGPLQIRSSLEIRSSLVWFVIISAIAFIGIIALYLTYSRSGYLAFMAAIGLLALFKSRRLLIAGILIIFLAFSFSPRVQERSLEAWDSGKALFGLNSQKPMDPTAQLRVFSWKFAVEIIKDHPWVGVGYNRYPYEFNKRGHGFLNDHGSGGSDSSLLTVWATSGIFGLLSYLAIYFTAFVIAVKRFIGKNDFQSYTSAGIIAGIGGLMIHSIFVNSLLFPLMMVYLMAGLGLIDEE